MVRAGFSSDGRGIVPAYCRRRLLLLLHFLSIVDGRSVLLGIKGYFFSINYPSISLDLVILIRIEQARSDVLFGGLVLQLRRRHVVVIVLDLFSVSFLCDDWRDELLYLAWADVYLAVVGFVVAGVVAYCWWLVVAA